MPTTDRSRPDTAPLGGAVGIQRFAVARSPLRISLAGGGTDLPSFAATHGGLVVGAAINRFVAVALFPREFTGRVRAALDTYAHCDEVADHPDALVRACLRRTGLTRDVQLASFSDAPGGSGLGSSGAFTVALAHAATFDQGSSTQEIAEAAAAVEIDDLRRPVGKQDHYLAAFGGMRTLRFRPDGRVSAEKLAIRPEVRAELESRLVLFHSGISRDAGEVLTTQHQRTLYGDRAVLDALHRIRGIAEDMIDALTAGEVDAVGPMIHEHWQLKSQFSKRICPAPVSELYELALRHGAVGGKLLGSGGGGFLLLCCRPGRQQEVRRALTGMGCRELTFRFAAGGSQATWLPL